jgi:hypothetical protein
MRGAGHESLRFRDVPSLPRVRPCGTPPSPHPSPPEEGAEGARRGMRKGGMLHARTEELG